MKRFLYYTVFCCVAFALGSCTQNEELESIKAGSDYIQITTSLAQSKVTRADDSSVERTVEHIDVFVVASEGADAGKVVHYERNTAGNNSGADADGAGTLTLSVKRGDAKFAADAKYAIYLVANSTITAEAAAALATLDNLNDWVQSDALLHVTGTNLSAGTPPQTFLMQAIAGSDSGQVINSSSGNGENLTLSAQFERAAAKIVVNIKQGDDVEFYKELSDESTKGSALYFFNMLPTKSYVLPTKSLAIADQNLVTTTELGPNTHTYIWTETAGHTATDPKHDITLVGYAYAHDWSTAEPLNETCIIVNIPMKWNKDGDASNGKEVTACNSWYMIPLSQNETFERNTCYVVNVTINTAGASDRTSVVELDGIEFKTLPWQEVEISVGDSSNEPKYLMLNKDVVKIYNTNLDDSQLTFSSSSPIKSVTLKDVYTHNADDTFTKAADSYKAYYVNKFGIKTSLSSDVMALVSATAEQKVLNGNISILSPILSTTEAERTKALAALGTEPTRPAEVAEPAGKPEPNIPASSTTTDTSEENIDRDKVDVTTTTTVSYSFEGEGENIKVTQTTTVDKTYRRKGGHGGGPNDSIVHVDGYPTTTTVEYDWAGKNDYITAYNTWATNNAEAYAEYKAYLTALEAYNAYQAAITAINNSANSGDTHYNTIRYLEFEVTNQQGLTATFRVMQYPVIYITNQLCWFSYRDDFGGTTYLNKGTNRSVCATYDNGWGYSTEYDADDNFFASKVAQNYNENTGASTLYYYEWDNNSNLNTPNSSGNTNAHYYHVHVTATSSEYTIGIPKVDSNGYTVSSADNARLVSPSFMIASQLGAVWSGKTGFNRDAAAYHCSKYVEVYKLSAYEQGAKTTTENGQTVYYKELRGWRLPTAAEIDIIVDHQTGVAMDVVLAGGRYYSAGPNQYTSTGLDNDDTTIYTRCIRDAY